jgi:hypothetical protein
MSPPGSRYHDAAVFQPAYITFDRSRDPNDGAQEANRVRQR